MKINPKVIHQTLCSIYSFTCALPPYSILESFSLAKVFAALFGLSFFYCVLRGKISLIPLGFQSPISTVFVLISGYYFSCVFFGLVADPGGVNIKTIPYYFNMTMALNLIIFYVLICTFFNDFIAFKASVLSLFFGLLFAGAVYGGIGFWYFDLLEKAYHEGLPFITIYGDDTDDKFFQIQISSDGRLQLSSYNEAQFGIALVLAAIFSIHMLIKQGYCATHIQTTAAFAVFLLIILFAITTTGTRTAFFCLILLSLVCILHAWVFRLSNRQWISAILLLTLITTSALVWASTPMSSRLASTLSGLLCGDNTSNRFACWLNEAAQRKNSLFASQNTSGGRYEIWESAIASSESIFVPGGFWATVMKSLNDDGVTTFRSNSSHNIFIDTLLWNGITGFILLTATAVILVNATLKYTKKAETPIALMLLILLAVTSVSLPIFPVKIFWLESSMLLYLIFYYHHKTV
ncbi:O-antigen ligase family protein [Alphaproteobacteria bacterium]|nr:O-antigen ligase family protein [Alphaproteobacteria bacterium]